MKNFPGVIFMVQKVKNIVEDNFIEFMGLSCSGRIFYIRETSERGEV